MMILREVIGEVLYEERMKQRRTLRDVAKRATLSLGYLSEIETGKKEPSSETLSKVCHGLYMPMSNLLEDASKKLRAKENAGAYRQY
jgi:transcriptional regulator with XRE-family HTH domain